SRFKRDYKRESRGRHRKHLDTSLVAIVEALANEQPLDHRHHDHALSGKWGDYRDCHVKPDLVLIYQESGADILRLVRLGSHAELGL
ncbi:MAG: type II toxin-antitoxin system YafQ family toxin, partial [Gemmatimonadetes bacterium]|nr:type II toxin-antitoxin system YafQ family toxin [Gemmatimonadota bacterium]